MWRLGICAGVRQVRSCTLQSSVSPFLSQLQHLKPAEGLQDGTGLSHGVISQPAPGAARGRRHLFCRSRLLQRLFIHCLLYFTFSAFFSLAGHWQAGAEGASLCPWLLLHLCVPVLSPLDGSSSTATAPAWAPTHNLFSQISTGFSPYFIFYLSLCIQERHSSVFGFLSVQALLQIFQEQGPGQAVEKGHVPAVGQADFDLGREMKLSLSISFPSFIRLYQQQLKQAGIYCLITLINNLISHRLKNDPHFSRLCN